MAKPRVLILKAAGVNCDAETAQAFESAGARTQFVHVNELVAGRKKMSGFQILALSGGFTYGDDIAAGKILANELKCKLVDDLKEFVDDGKLVIGICNGFQVLVKAGLLPGGPRSDQEATLAGNDSGLFEDRWVYLKSPGHRVTGSQVSQAAASPVRCVWTKGLPEVITLPVAHGEGKFIPKNEEVLQRLWRNGQVVLQYCDARGQAGDFPVNPNGSVDSIAGICDETGRVFGLMPHPERHLISLQHPRWTREGVKRHGDGFAIFLNAVNFFRK